MYGVTPDLTTMAKILAGGLPGGAVAGRADIMDLLDFGDDPAGTAQKMVHPGTYNANPLSAAAGVTALRSSPIPRCRSLRTASRHACRGRASTACCCMRRCRASVTANRLSSTSYSAHRCRVAPRTVTCTSRKASLSRH